MTSLRCLAGGTPRRRFFLTAGRDFRNPAASPAIGIRNRARLRSA
ncbi:hypothetical protein SF83666_c00420 [Sinorhizobium fredii CCBAU 83666]|nr:hypothetical protein SF83666_c00420 [Sinorhizobium fredii CCBAU 83666]